MSRNRARVRKCQRRRVTARNARRAKSRGLGLEALESRTLLSTVIYGPVAPAVDDTEYPVNTQVYTPGGNGPFVDPPPWRGDSGGNFQMPDDYRWSRTATNGINLQQGDATTLTWSLVPDGSPINGFNGEEALPSDLIQRLDNIYQVPNNTPITQREWFTLFVRMFDSWAATTGLQFVYEPNDDGVAISSANRGVLNTRGDVRIGGHPIDGNYNVLAYNFYPDMGDMVIDTNDSFFTNKSNESRHLRNVTAHEMGHGIGLNHVCPINETKLLEPFYSGKFDGPQHDDVLAGNRGYGDPHEYPYSNDSVDKATDVGTLADGSHLIDAASIDDVSDVDYFKFTVAADRHVSLALRPVGSTYLSGPQNSDGSCSGGTSFNSKAQNDLAIEVWTVDGRMQLAAANATGAGANETIDQLALPSEGDYLIKVTGADPRAQLYEIDVTVAEHTGTVDGIVELEQRVFHLGGAVTVAVRDADLIGQGSVSVGLQSTAGDTEQLSLAEVGGGVFRGMINLASAASVTADDGTLQANSGDVLTATYQDAANASGSAATVHDTAEVFAQSCTTKDGFGYTACNVAYDFNDIRSSGTELLRNSDASVATLTASDLGGFSFDFYGTTYNSVSVNTNGILTFGGALSGLDLNRNLTNSPSLPSIAAFWDDLRTDGISDEVYWQVTGTGAQQQLIVQWNDVAFSDMDTDAVDDRGNGVTFQVILSEADDSIRLNYRDLDGGPSVDGNEGVSATAGIKDSGNQGGRRILLAYNNGPNSFVGSAQSVLISRQSTLGVTVDPATIAENDGTSAATGTVTRTNADMSVAQVVNLASSDTSEATVPATVTIPANQASATFAISAVDDALLDGTQSVMVTATANGFVAGSDTLDVTDHETLTVAITADSIAENAGTGATTATLTRSNTDTTAALVVNLASDDTTEASVPATLTIPANASSATFTIDAVDDALLDGTQTVMLTATAGGYVAGSDTLEVTDHETLTVAITADSIAENAGVGATTATLTRSNTDTTAALVVNLASDDTTEASVPATVTIPANASTATFTIDAVDDALLDGTQTVMLTATAGGYVSGSDTLDVTDYETLTVAITADSIAENAGTGATTATLTRSNTDTAAALVVDLASNDTTEATAPATVTIPANASSATFAIDAVDDAVLDGTQTVTLTATAGGYVSGSDTLEVTDHETLTVAITADSIAENAGTGATTATLTRSNTDTTAALVVNLASDDTTEATVPATVTIPANASSATFTIDAVDDALLDGTQTVTLTATAGGYVAGSDMLDVKDHETLTVAITADSIAENAGSGATTATLTRSNTDTAAALVVNLASNDTTEATVPATVTIPANASSATFTIDAIDDAVLDGTQTVTLTATAGGYVAGSDMLDVTDYETLTVTVTADSIAENAGTGATTATLTRSNTDTTAALVVNLASDDTTEATVPATVTIPANASSATFTIDAIDDTLLDGTQTVTLTATAGGYVAGSDTLDVTDHETLTVAITADSIAENAGTGATTATLTRSNTDTAAALVVNLASDDTTESTVPATVTIAANQTSATFAIDAVDDALLDGTQTVTLTATAGGYVTGSDTLDVTDHETLTVAITADSIAENAGTGATTATLTRSNTDTTAALVVNLASNDTTEASVPATVTILANASSATFTIDAIDDTLLDGTQTVTLTATAGGYVAGSDTLDVTDYETLTVTVAADSIAENAGTGATTATLTRSNTDTTAALVVNLASNDTTEASVPATVTIPANASSATFTIDAVDDAVLDGTQTVTLTATAGGYVAGSDTLDVTDYETLTVAITADSIAENAGAGATTATLTRSNTDTTAALVVDLASDDVTEASVPITVTIPANASSATFTIDAVDDAVLDGTQTVTLTAATGGYVSGSDTLDVTDYETLTVAITADSIAENAGTGATTATLTRSNTDTTAALVVNLASNDTTEATVPATVTIPANQTSATFTIDAIDDTLLDGTQTVTLTATAGGYVAGSDMLDVTDYETLTVAITADSIAENAGTGATTATLTRSNTDTAAALVVNLASNDTTEASVPATVTIPANASSATFAIDAVDDTLLDGTQTVTLTAATGGYVAGSDTLDVTDYETLTVAITADSIAENAGTSATTATLTRSNTDTAAALVVDLASDDATEATVPITVTIPANESSATFAIDAVDDTLLDGTQTVTLTAATGGYVSGSDTLDVTDHETLTITFAADSVREQDGQAATTAMITRSNTDVTLPLLIDLSGGDSTELALPSSVVIPAEQQSMEVPVDAVEDYIVDGDQTVGVAVSADHYVGGSDSIVILDNTTPWHNWHRPLDVNNDGRITPLDALIIINFINAGNTGLPAPPATPPPFYDTYADNHVTPLDALLLINFLNGVSGGEGELANPVAGATAASSLLVAPICYPATSHDAGADRVVTQPVRSLGPQRPIDNEAIAQVDYLWAQTVSNEVEFGVRPGRIKMEADDIDLLARDVAGKECPLDRKI